MSGALDGNITAQEGATDEAEDAATAQREPTPVPTCSIYMRAAEFLLDNKAISVIITLLTETVAQ